MLFRSGGFRSPFCAFGGCKPPLPRSLERDKALQSNSLLGEIGMRELESGIGQTGRLSQLTTDLGKHHAH